MLNFLKILVERGAIHEFESCESAYRESYNRDRGVVEAEVTTAQALSDTQRNRLVGKLMTMTGKEILLKEKVDPDVIGGVLLQMGGR
ncbi:MAG: F0F1 ATP synthase subunit delta, partial [Clostridia bacterium]|nr:F0F1 ATP synthase subunit delta [Clostridia bacterium]